MFLQEIIKRFMLGVETCHTIDCVLVRLSSAIYELEDLAKQFQKNSAELVNDFLSNKQVRQILRGLYDDIDIVMYKIQVDPRFKNLKAYSRLIEQQILESRKLISTKRFAPLERKPLWRIEYEEKHPSESYEIPVIHSNNYRTYTETRESRDLRYEPNTSVKRKSSIKCKAISLIGIIVSALLLLYSTANIVYGSLTIIEDYMRTGFQSYDYTLIISVIGYALVLYAGSVLMKWCYRHIHE